VTEPPRLHTEPESELERSLLAAGRSYTASDSSRAKALAALGIVGVTASSTTAASAVTKAGLAKWLAGAVLLAGAAVPAVHYFRQHSAVTSAPSMTAPALTLRSAAPTPAPTASAAPGEPTPTDPANSPANASASAPSAPRAEAKPTSAPALSAELSALDAARSALASGDATGALSGLDAYARNFPHGKLSLEAEVLRIDALAKSGQTGAAQKRAAAFIKRHPDSVLASRVRAYAGQ
jgi:hypothetical protein